MADLHLTSTTNPRLKSVVKFRRRRARDEAGVAVVEGYEELALAVESGVRAKAIYYCPDLMHDPDQQLQLVDAARADGTSTISLSRSVFEKVAYREGPDGFLAVLPAVGGDLSRLRLPEAPLLLVAEGIEKPGNLGAMLRTADAAGIDAVIAVDPTTDWSNPNVIRGSKGTVFTVPVAATTLDELVPWMGARGIRLVATTPDATTLHTDADLTGPVAIAVGTEKHGLTAAALAAADVAVRIPMAGRVNSLNAGVAAAVVVYEAVRQRSS